LEVTAAGKLESPNNERTVDVHHTSTRKANKAKTHDGQPVRNGNSDRCAHCSRLIKARRGSRRQRYCSYQCRDAARRERNFAAFVGTRRGSQAIPRSVQNNASNSNTYKCGLTDRPSAALRFPINLLGGHRWQQPTDAERATLIARAIAVEIGGVR
jgi:hypothetical protein